MVTAKEKWTVARVLQWAADDFKTKGFESPRLEAEHLLSSLLGLQRIELYTGFDRPLAEEELTAFRDAIRRRRSGEPAAYITGEKEFWSLRFEVNEHVLIPRPDTETLVSVAVEHLKGEQLLDLCTGSGCIAVALASERENLEVHGVDLSTEALEVATKNVATHGLSERVTLWQGDLFEPCPDGARYDGIVSNPPYVTEAQMKQLSAEVQREPSLALVAGADGLDIVRRILAQAPDYLNPGGLLALEIDPDQADAVAGDLGTETMGAPGQIARDLAGRARVVYWADWHPTN